MALLLPIIDLSSLEMVREGAGVVRRVQDGADEGFECHSDDDAMEGVGASAPARRRRAGQAD